MGVTNFIITGTAISANAGGVQRWSYDNSAKTFTYLNSFISTVAGSSSPYTDLFDEVCEDPDRNVYLRNRTGNLIYKSAATTWALVTGWGSGGYVSCPADNVERGTMAINTDSHVFAASDIQAFTSTNVYAWTSTGAGKWIATLSTISNVGSLGLTSAVVVVFGGTQVTARTLTQSTGTTVASFASVVGRYAASRSGDSVFYAMGAVDGFVYDKASPTYAITSQNLAGTTGNIRDVLLHTNGYTYVAANFASGGRIRALNTVLVAIANSNISLVAGSVDGICQTTTGQVLALCTPLAGAGSILYAFSASLTVDAVITSVALSTGQSILAQTPNSLTTAIQSPVDKLYSRRMVAFAQNKLWYENISSEIVSLDASISALDCTKGLTACEAYQKVFVANNSVLAVADFAGTKVYTQTIGVVPPRGTIITGTSGAEMVVDLVTDAAGTCEVYGTTYTTTAFLSTDTCTNAALSVSFALAAGETTGPHWHNWQTYTNSSTYGAIPEYATLVALYRGRLVLAGNPQYPYQWYMSRVANPWDFEYSAGDPLTAIAGSDADAGLLGDIIRALIPYSPDFMIFGCANSMWLLNGDPAAGGSLDEITKDTGIYGPRSWCKDDKGDLYFFGTYGLYHMAGGRGQPSNILSAVWPNLIEDWGLNPSNHRVVMEYDVQRAGVVVCMTNLSDGANKAFFYHVPTGAVLPETYHSECAPYSMCAYPSDDAENKGLILGCYDAYLRRFDDGATEDVGSVTTAAVISAYVGWVEKLTEDDDTNARMNWLFIETGGAISGDTQVDTTGVNMSLYAADDAETCMQKMAVGTVAFLSTSFSGNGRQNKFRQRIKTPYLGVQFATSSVAAYWTINKVVGDVEPSGGIR